MSFPDHIDRDPYNFETAYVHYTNFQTIANDSLHSGVSIEQVQNDIFGNEKYLPEDIFKERIEKHRKKHPEDFDIDPLEMMHKKAYGNE